MLFAWLALGGFAFLLVIVVIIVLIRAQSFGRTQPSIEAAELPAVDALTAANHLADAVRCQTVAHGADIPLEDAPFLELIKSLEKNYPLTHQHLSKEIYHGFNLVYHWQGSAEDMDPLLFMAHLDVVPADPATLEQWKYPPFSGEVAEGKVWGRGAIDCKTQLIGVMEAVEHLLQQGYQPERSIYLAFGQDEEIGGLNGQKKLAEHFKNKGVHFSAVLDEGGSILSGNIPGVKVPVALVGNCEKGYLSLRLEARGSGGHSSMPPRQTTIGRLARAIALLEANPVPSDLNRIVPLFAGIGSKAPFFYRMAFANQWLFRNYLLKKLESSPKMAAVIRTTTAPTIIHGGVKDNILPSEASAVVNFRLSAGDTIDSVIEYVKFLLRELEIEVTVQGGHPGEASPVSEPSSPAFALLDRCIRQTFGDVAVAPFIMLGATDARYYAELSDNIYRFMGLRLEEGQMDTVHNINEYVGVEQFKEAVQFFILLMQQWAKASWVVED